VFEKQAGLSASPDLEDLKLFSSISEYRQQITAFDRRKLKGWLWKYCRNHLATADDLAQIVHTKLWEADIEQVLKIRDLDKFVWGVCRHVGADWQRELKKRARVDDGAKSLAVVSPRTPEASVIFAEYMRRVQAAINQLSEKRREVYVMYHQRGYSIEQIAQILGCRVGTVKRTLYDAMKSVRQVMAEGESVDETQSIIRLLGAQE
jgi:RNA polymerase sigma factor (sigma-70 family)